MAKKDGGDVVPGVFGGKHTIEHMIKHFREESTPKGSAILMFENKAGDIIPVVLNLSLEELCLCKEILGNIILTMLNEEEWEEKD